MRRTIIFIILILLIPSSASAIKIAGTTDSANIELLNMTTYANNVFDEVIQIIPKEALVDAESITQIRFWCGYNNTNGLPNQNLVFRFFKYYGAGVFSPIDNSYILPSQCQDNYGYLITWNLYSEEIIDHNYDYAFGVYSNSVTESSWDLPVTTNITGIDPIRYNWLNTTTSAPIINESIVDLNGANYQYNSVDIRAVSLLNVYGNTISPTPTPEPTPTGTLPNPTPISTTDPSIWEGNNISYNGSANGTYSVIPNGTGFDQILTSDGLCTSGTCTTTDGIEWLTRHINDLFILTFGIVLFKAWSMKQ